MKKIINKIEIDSKAKRILNSYFKRKNITIIDILENAGFDTNKPSKIYLEKSIKGNTEIIYEYENKKYTINLYSDRYIEIINYSYYNDGKDRQYDSYLLYKINKKVLEKSHIKPVHAEINTLGYYKKDENNKLIETSYEESEIYFSHQEVYWVDKKIWAIRVMPSNSFPYHIELKYYSGNNKMPNIKMDIINHKLKQYFITINMNTPIIEILKKICEINSITLDELSNGDLSFGISKKDKNYNDEEVKYLSFKNGILEVTENNETTIYEKQDDDYKPKDISVKKLKI